jgi:flagellar M-ring protein FliF
MDQLKKLIATLSWPQRAGILATAAVALCAILGLVHWRHEQDFRPLFTGMAPEDASAVVQKLKESGAEYRIGDGGATVSVPAEKLDELRLDLAGAGLPKTGRVGFELFDKTNLGITDFAEHVNYQRAIEGELERTIRTLNEVEQARVHVTFPKDSVFLDSREPAKASVLVQLKPGATLMPQNVLAITNLVASAVQGLTPDNVSVVDMQGNLLNRPHKGLLDDDGMSDGMLEYKHQIEKDLAAKVESTLEPLLGAGKFRVGVSADCDFATTDQSDEVLDPTRSVMVTSQKSEDIAGTVATSGVPGTASNLPRPPDAARPASTPGTASRRTESVTYDTSRTVRHVKTPEGSIKRISAALLLDQAVQWQGTGKQRKRVLVPPSPTELKAIHDVVAGVLGLDPQRGDQLVIESLPFEQTLSGDSGIEEPPAAPPAPNPFKLPWDKRIVLAGAGALLIGIVAAVALLRKKKRKSVEITGKRALPSAASASSIKGVVDDSDEQALGLADQAGSDSPQLAAGELPPFKFQLPPLGRKIEGMRAGMKELVQRDPSIAANVVRGWLEEDHR